MRAFVCGLVGLGIAAAATGNTLIKFEAPAYDGSAGGTPLTTGFGGGGQQGWYNPVAGSVDFNVHTYAGNTLGFASNPNGGGQFVGVAGTATPNNIGRAQRAYDFSAGGIFTISWDVIGAYVGPPTVAPINNLGSFSLQPSTTANFWQQIMQYGTPADPSKYNLNYGVFGAAGGAAATFMSAGPAWVDVPTNHWIHQSTTWDFGTNQILSVSIQDITAGGALTTVDVSGLGWYLAGGQNNVLAKAAPTDVRLFTGNTNNATGWDNLRIIPAPSGMLALGLGGLIATRRRRA